MTQRWLLSVMMGLMILLNFAAHAASQTPVDEKPNQNQITWQIYGDAAFDEAKKLDKNVLVFAKTATCKWCKRMEEINWQMSSIMTLVKDHYIPVKVLVEEDFDFIQQYQLVSVPVIMIFDGDKKLIKRVDGYIEPEEMINLLSSNAKSNKTNEIKKHD